MNLIPNKPGLSPNYFCTWSTQNFGRTDDLEDINLVAFEGDQGAKSARDYLSEDVVFSKNGMIDQYDKIRSDLFFVFDDGWDVPYGVHSDTQRFRFGSVELDEERFPSCIGDPTQRLKKLNDKVKSFGWRGAGLWIAAQAVGEGKEGFMMDDTTLKNYWRQRVKWSKEAGINYWKVDWGVRAANFEFREMLTAIGREEAPDLIIEHCRNCGPVNDDANVPWEQEVNTGDGRFNSWGTVLQEAISLISFSDVLRAYDVTVPLSTATTLDRVASILKGAKINKEAKGIINCEDEPYIGAALGCSIGVMRSAMYKEISGFDYDMRYSRKRLDEVVRAIRWQRLAPAFRADQEKVYLSNNILTDSWKFSKGESWAAWLIGNEVKQACPAVVTRGLELKVVNCKETSPFIVAARNPNGAISIAALPRTVSQHGIYTPLAQVELVVGDSEHPIGIFGKFESITLTFDENMNQKVIWGQDLGGNSAVDITDKVIVQDNRVLISGDIISEIGLMAATEGDVSDPGMVLSIV